MPIREAGRVHARARKKKPATRPRPTLREMREAAGLTRVEVAEAALIHYITLWRIEAGKVEPRPLTRAAVERAIQTLPRRKNPRHGRG